MTRYGDPKKWFPLSQAGPLFGVDPPPSKTSLKRYVTVGYRGYVLESRLVANQRYVTTEGIEQFLDKTSRVPRHTGAGE